MMHLHFVFLFAAMCCTPVLMLRIKCWDCRSDLDPKCGYPFDNSTIPITSCMGKAVPNESGLQARLEGTMCRTIKQKVNGTWVYIRDCAYVGEDGIMNDKEGCFTRTGTDNVASEYCVCNSKDGCNSSNTFSPIAILVSIFAGLSFLTWA